MSGGDGELSGPDLAAEGAAAADLAEGQMLLGHAGGDAVLLVRKGGTAYALGASCSHYGGPLAEGLFDGDLIRCPWHHACFRPETGEAVHAPALSPVSSYAVEERDGRLFVAGEREPAPPPSATGPASVVIIGGGAAAFAAAEMLRREGYGGPVTLVSADTDAPYDRPNLSKDYLAGKAPEDWIPLRGPEWYEEHDIDLRTGRSATALDPAGHRVILDSRETLEYGALLLATGASPIRLDLPGADLPHVHYLRSLADSRRLIAALEPAGRAVVIGASFIGLEVAASLTERGVEVHVVAPEPIPMERILGPELGAFVRSLHEEHGVHFHLEQGVTGITPTEVTLRDGSRVSAELVVIGVGVRPELALAESAGLAVDRGVTVDEQLRTSADGIWAAGDIARWPDPHSGERIRVEHWVVAERQGQTAARNILGRGERFAPAPFFWSQHYDVPINYVGHAEGWDELVVSGSIADRDCVVSYRKSGKTLAVASIYRDDASLRAEVAIERNDEPAVRAAAGPD